jgi:hypothetical protein
MSGKNKRPATKIPEDLSSGEAVKRFREAAAEFTKEGTRSKESAMKVLVDSRIVHGVRQAQQELPDLTTRRPPSLASAGRERSIPSYV